MTSAVCAKASTCAHAGVPRSARRVPVVVYKSNSANINTRDRVALSFNDEDDNPSRSGSPPWRATPEPDSKRSQYLSPPSPEDRTPRGGLARLMAKGTLRPTTSPPMSFPDALTTPKLLPRPKTRETRREGIHPTHTRRRRRHSPAKQRRKRPNCVCPGHSTLVITAALCHVRRVRVPQNLWRRMQLR